MMTAKQYVEDKVKSYTLLANRCRREAESSDDIVVRAECSARANVWEMCAEEMDNVREILEEESGRSHMPDTVRHVMWYTVWDAKSDDLLASGTAAMCARRLGYASANSFAASVCHWFKDGGQHVKYICQRELIPRSEVGSLPRKPKRPARVRSTDESRG